MAADIKFNKLAHISIHHLFAFVGGSVIGRYSWPIYILVGWLYASMITTKWLSITPGWDIVQSLVSLDLMLY